MCVFLIFVVALLEVLDTDSIPVFTRKSSTSKRRSRSSRAVVTYSYTAGGDIYIVNWFSDELYELLYCMSKMTDQQTDMNIYNQTDMNTTRQRNRQIDRTDRETDGRTDGQTDRQIDPIGSLEHFK